MCLSVHLSVSVRCCANVNAVVTLLGPLLGEVVKNMKDKRSGTLDAQQKAFIYSAVSNGRDGQITPPFVIELQITVM